MFKKRKFKGKELRKFNKQGISLKYIGGHPNFANTTYEAIITGGDGAVNIYSWNGKDYAEGKLIDYSWGEKGKRSGGKAATGAIVGGVLTGGLGAVAGAAVGGRKKDNSILTLVLKEDNKKYVVQFRADNYDYNKFVKKVL